MKINKDVYTQELDKAYTILKQQYIIIRCMLELIDNSNTNEDKQLEITNAINEINIKLAELETGYNGLYGTVRGHTNNLNNINSYLSTIQNYIVQNGNTTELGGNLEVDGNTQVNGNLNIEGNLTIDGQPLVLDNTNVVRENTLGEFLNSVFSYQSKDVIPNELQTNANVQNLKQISRDTTAIIARYGSFDYVLQIDTLVGDSSVRAFINGYLYNPNIKDVIFVSINTVNGLATLRFNTDSGGTSESPILELNTVGMDLYNLLTTDTNEIIRPATNQEKTFFTDVITRLSNGEKIGGFITALSTIRAYFQFMTSDGYHITFKTSRLSLEYNYEYTVVYRSTYTDEEILVFKQQIYPQSSGLGEPIVLTYTEGSSVLNIPATLENGEYIGIISVGNTYTFTTNFYLDFNYNQFIGTSISGELATFNFIIGPFINKFTSTQEWVMSANVLTLDSDKTWSKNDIGDLWELVKLIFGRYPTFTLYKKN